MHFPTEIDGGYLAISIILLCLAAYLRHRLKQRRLARMQADLDTELQPSGDAFDDGFYCIRLKDGTTRAGFIDGE